MRTLWIILGGFVLWAVCLGIEKTLTKTGVADYLTATFAFLVIWFAAAGFNMWVGVTQAGYAWQEELPIFLLIFGLPAVVALLVKWKYL